jgi:hypothetical protein
MSEKTKKSKRNYDVGYKKPPPQHRFPPGESGNKKGRPKGVKNYESIWQEILDGKVPMGESGRKITVKEALIRKFVSKAASGDTRALMGVLAAIAAIDNVQGSEALAGLSPKDQELLERSLNRIGYRKVEEGADDTSGDQ